MKIFCFGGSPSDSVLTYQQAQPEQRQRGRRVLERSLLKTFYEFVSVNLLNSWLILCLDSSFIQKLSTTICQKHAAIKRIKTILRCG